MFTFCQSECFVLIQQLILLAVFYGIVILCKQRKIYIILTIMLAINITIKLIIFVPFDADKGVVFKSSVLIF